MLELDYIDWKAKISLDSYGVRLSIRANEPEVLETIANYSLMDINYFYRFGISFRDSTRSA